MECRSGNDNDDYLYMDPKLLKSNRNDSMPKTRAPFQDAIVFIVGGGNYIEYQNLVDFIKVSWAIWQPTNVFPFDFHRITTSEFFRCISAKADRQFESSNRLRCINVGQFSAILASAIAAGSRNQRNVNLRATPYIKANVFCNKIYFSLVYFCFRIFNYSDSMFPCEHALS